MRTARHDHPWSRDPSSDWSLRWIPEAVAATGGAAHLARRGRRRAAATVLASWAGGRLGVFAAGGTEADAAGVGAAYGLGRIAPPWRIPLLAASGSLHLAAGRSDRGAAWRDPRLVAGVAGAMAAVAVAERWPSRHPPRAQRRQVAVVVNVHSGSPHLARRAVRALRRQPVDITTIELTTGHHLAGAFDRATASLPADGVLAVAGGDGTVGRGAAQAAQTGHALAIFPTGTGNDVARSLGIPPTPEEAAALVGHGEPSPMDLGVAGTHLFCHAATIGMTAEFAERVRAVSGWRRPLLYPAMAWGAWRDRQPLAVQVVVDGRPMPVPSPPFQVGVVNAPRLGGRIGFPLAGASVDDGLFDVLVAHRDSLRHVARTLSGLLRTRASRPLSRTTIESGRVVDIQTPTPVMVCLDGEPLTFTPLRASVRAGACQVIRPR